MCAPSSQVFDIRWTRGIQFEARIQFHNDWGETNVTGSAKFRKLIEANDFDGALQVAIQQVRSGANIIDVNMDEGMLDSVSCMERF